MRKLLLVLAALAATSIAPSAAVADGPRPQANCPGTDVYVVYNAAVGCNVNPPQRLHLVWLPSTWTLAQAHTYCADAGAAGVQTRFNGYANVCPNVAY